MFEKTPEVKAELYDILSKLYTVVNREIRRFNRRHHDMRLNFDYDCLLSYDCLYIEDWHKGKIVYQIYPKQNKFYVYSDDSSLVFFSLEELREQIQNLLEATF